MTVIATLPTPPSRDDIANFRTQADALLGALPDFVTQTNTVSGEVNAAAAAANQSKLDAAGDAATALAQAGIATTQASNAAASAVTALNAPGTSATSTTSLVVATGVKSLTIQTGKQIVVGMSVAIAYTFAPTIRMIGTVIGYNSGTGVLDVSVVDVENGGGTFTSWTVSLTAAFNLNPILRRMVQIKVLDDATVVTTGDNKAIFCVPSDLNGYNLIEAQAFVTTASTSGVPTIQLRNVTDAVDMLSTRITLDINEFTSYTAAVQPIINTATDDVATGDRIAIDVDIAGTGTKGLGVMLTFKLP